MKAVVVRSSLVLCAFLYMAAPGGAQTRLGALAIDERQGGQYGWAVDYETAGTARQRALSECGSGCSVVLTFGRCAAYAADQDASSTAFGWAESYDSAAGARQRALAECSSRGGSACTVRVWGCNGPVVEESLSLGRAARREIQEGLQAAGHDPGGADGLFGPRTRAAIRSWQASRGVRATGYLDGVAAAALRPAGVAVPTFRLREPPPEAEPAAGAAATAQPPSQPARPATVPELEGLFWQSIVNSENPTDFEAYLAQFPNGVFRRLAENRLSALQPAPPSASSAAPEALFWQSIVNSENPADFESYLAQFPNGVFRRLAENRLSALQPAPPSASSAAPEALFWQSIANSENPAEFEAYLAQFPNGVFRNLAESRLSALQSPAGAPVGVSGPPSSVADSPASGATGLVIEADVDLGLSPLPASEQGHGALAIDVEGGRHSLSPDGEAHALNMCGTAECDVVATFSACMGVAYSSLAQGRVVWTWMEAATAEDARVGALGECTAAGGPACEVLNVLCLDAATSERPSEVAGLPASGSRISGTGDAAGSVVEITADPALRPGEVFRDCAVCPEMVVLAGGGLALGRYEVTVGEYGAFASATGGGAGGGCTTFGDGDFWRDPGFPQTDRYPVACVSWDDAQEYVSWLSRRTGATYRLPTGGEWERAAAGSPTGCGSRLRAFLDGSDEGTCEVGTNGTNAAGLFDMVGNLWEWTSDCWEGDCGRRVLRGGSWFNDAEDLRSGARYGFAPVVRYDSIGFRVSRTLD